MTPRILLLFVWLLVSGMASGNAQSVTSDPQAVAVLTGALAASGAANPLNPVRSFTASGTITYFWAGERVQALATIRAQGHDQFRMDATLPGGTRSVAISRDSGTRKDENGKRAEIPLHNTISKGGSSFPYLAIATALKDPTVTVSYIGLAESGTQKWHQVRTIRNVPSEQDPQGILAKLSQTDYFVDSQTNLVVKVEDMTHPVETLTEEYPRVVELEGYTAMNGVAVPTVVRHKISGNTVWEFHLSTISFNTNFTDADFSLP